MNKKPFSFEVRMRLKSFDYKKIEILKSQIKLVAYKYHLHYSSISLPVEKSRITILKSPHVNKKAKDQFEVRVVNSLIILKGLTFNSPFFLRLREFESDEIVSKLVISLFSVDV